MVKITNGLTTIEVTAGAFKSIYQRQGFELVDPSMEDVNEQAEQAEEVTAGADEKTENEDTQTSSDGDNAGDGKDTNDEGNGTTEGDKNASGDGNGEEEQTDKFADLITKPVSQWSKEEMQEFVKDKGIDTSKAKNVSDAKKIIAEYIDSIQ